jgi:serine protease Do
MNPRNEQAARRAASRAAARSRAVSAVALASALVLGSPAAVAETAPVEQLPSFAPMVERVLPAVVNISVVQKAPGSDEQSEDDDQGDNGEQEQAPGPGGPGGQTPFDEFLRRFFEQQQQQNHHGMPVPVPGQKIMALGSGFIIDPAGYIVTNNHVVGDADKVTVIFQDDTKHPAKIIGKDVKTDLALLKIDAPKPLPFVKFGDSDKARVGDWVIAVGDPFGLGGTVTKGIISARGREPMEQQSYVDYLQVDASINKGNSGGPTFDLEGDVIGINTAIFSPNGGSVGIGFAIPSNSAKPVIEQLKSAGHVDRGWLGVQIQEVTPEIASSLGLDKDHPTGALIAAVTENSPAAKAGLKVGDVILKFQGKGVEKMRDLPRLVADTDVGKTVDLTVLRSGQQITVPATIAHLDDTAVASAQGGGKADKTDSLGLTLSALNPDVRKRLGLPDDLQGVLVSRVKDGSPAADRGIEAGDVITQVNAQPVGNPEDVVTQVKALKPGDSKSILLLINRHGQNRFVAVEPEEKKG